MLVADEVQTGICRTGKLFAMEHWGVAPDIMTTAKSLAAGMPLAGITGRAEIMEASHVGGLGGTYGGNPVACAAAMAVLDFVAENDLSARAETIGRHLRQRFEGWQAEMPLIGDVRGLGAMMALELVSDRETKAPATAQAKQLVQHCHQNGLVLLSCGKHGNVIRTLMPLVITDDQLAEGLDILENGLKAVSGG
jgi:4-aminobutyrate aminotransferase/(S)-3-amino-2-methylpropionate transaminase